MPRASSAASTISLWSQTAYKNWLFILESLSIYISCRLVKDSVSHQKRAQSQAAPDGFVGLLHLPR